MWHWEFSSVITKKALPSHEGHEVVTPLFIAQGSRTDCTFWARHHVMDVFLMSLDIATEFKVNVFAIVKVFAGQQIPWQESVRGPASVRKGIEPEHCIGNKVNEHKAWNTFEQKGAIAAASLVFDSVNVPYQSWEHAHPGHKS